MKPVSEYQLGEPWALTAKERKRFMNFRTDLIKEIDKLKRNAGVILTEIENCRNELHELDVILGKVKEGDTQDED